MRAISVEGKKTVEDDFRLGPWLVQPQLNSISDKDRNDERRLEPKVMQVLAYLAEHAGEVVPKEELIKAVWPDVFVTDDALARCISELRRALEDDTREPRFIQTIVKGGYRLIAEVKPVEEADTPKRGVPVAATPRRPAVLAAGFLVLALLSAAGYLGWRWFRPPSAPSGGQVRLAVLPLQNLSGDAEQQYFTDGMTEAIITDLAQIGALRVISRTSALAYRDRRDTLPAMARELKVDHVVEGSVLRAGNRVRITVQLVDATNDRHLWAQNYEGDLRDILRLQSEVAQAIAREVRVRLTPGEQARLSNRARVNPKAYEFMLKGYHHTLKWKKSEVFKGREYFQQAIAEDPGYAPAYVGLADTYITQGFQWGVRPTELLPKAEAAVAQAIRLDGELFPAYHAQGMLQGVYKRNWPEAERQFRRARELAPQDEWSTYLYPVYYLVPLGRLDEALERIQRSRESAPLSLNVNVWVGWIRLFRREYGLAVDQFRKTLELDPNFEFARTGLVVALAELGRFEEALAVRHSLDYIEHNAWVWALAGKQAEARRVLRQLIERSKREYVGGWELAWLHAALGEKDLAFQQLARSYQDHQPQLAHLKVDPRLDSLRSDPRFRELVRKMNLEQ